MAEILHTLKPWLKPLFDHSRNARVSDCCETRGFRNHPQASLATQSVFPAQRVGPEDTDREPLAALELASRKRNPG